MSDARWLALPQCTRVYQPNPTKVYQPNSSNLNQMQTLGFLSQGIRTKPDQGLPVKALTPKPRVQIPTLGFLYVAGYIGSVGRDYLTRIKGDAKPRDKEIIIDVPLALKCSLAGIGWPAKAIAELRSGSLTEDDVRTRASSSLTWRPQGLVIVAVLCCAAPPSSSCGCKGVPLCACVWGVGGGINLEALSGNALKMSWAVECASPVVP